MNAPANNLAGDRARIEDALLAAGEVLTRHARGDIDYEVKPGHGPVTAADHEVDALLRKRLPRGDDGWLSEETPDDQQRLGKRRVWIVDPLDGTRSFVAKRPEYSVSIGLLVDGQPALGGVHNPATGVTVLGGKDLGLSVKGQPSLRFGADAGGNQAVASVLRVLGSRSEIKGGEFAKWQDDPAVLVLPISSIAYKLALVAVGAADATWTMWPKHEWDVAAGAALLLAAGGSYCLPRGLAPAWNQRRPRYGGFIAAGPDRGDEVRTQLGL